MALVFAGALVGSILVAYLFGHRPHHLLIPPSPVVQGVSDDEILFGMTGPFNGPVHEIGRNMSVGINACFQSVNEQGGVAGRRLKLINLDDGYDPDRALANMTELYEQDKVFGFVGNIGSAAAVKTLPYTLEKKALDFGCFSGAQVLRRDPPDRHIFNYRASYAEETAAIVKYLVDVRKVKPEEIAVFAQNDAYGDDAFRGAVKAIHQFSHDHRTVLRVGYDRNSLRINDAVQTILQKADIHAIVLAANYKPAAAFIERIKDARPTMIFASVSGVGAAALAEELVEHGPQYAAGTIITQVVPPVNSGGTLVLKYRDTLKRYFPSERPNSTSLEGYIDAVILVEGLKRAGKNLTTETLVDALESIHDFDLGTGTLITFSPSRHQASHKVWGVIFDRTGNILELALDE